MTKGAVTARMHTQITCTLHWEPVKWELVSCAEMSWHVVVMTNMTIRNGKTLHSQSVFLAAWQTIYHAAVIVQKELWKRKDWALHYIYCAAPLMKMENSNTVAVLPAWSLQCKHCYVLVIHDEDALLTWHKFYLGPHCRFLEGQILQWTGGRQKVAVFCQ